MSDMDPSPDLSKVNIKIDQARGLLRMGCQSPPAVPSPRQLSPWHHSIKHRVPTLMLSINYSTGQDSFD